MKSPLRTMSRVVERVCVMSQRYKKKKVSRVLITNAGPDQQRCRWRHGGPERVSFDGHERLDKGSEAAQFPVAYSSTPAWCRGRSYNSRKDASSQFRVIEGEEKSVSVGSCRKQLTGKGRLSGVRSPRVPAKEVGRRSRSLLTEREGSRRSRFEAEVGGREGGTRWIRIG